MIVLFKGGTSVEREVSLASARAVAEALKDLGVEFIEVDTAAEGWLDQTVLHNPTKVLIALHGTYGEDGQIQEQLEKNDIEFTGSSSSVCALAFDKHATKTLLRKFGVSSPVGTLTWRGARLGQLPELPVVVKPNRQGSSFGVTIVKNDNQLAPAVEEASRYDNDIIIEEYLPGPEFTCGVINLFGHVEALPVVEIVPDNQFFDYFTKYDPAESAKAEICPARIMPDLAKKIQVESIRVFELLHINQYCRVDWIIHSGEPYFLEVNTLPGITKTSLLPKELLAAGISYKDFIKALIADS